MGMLYKPIVMSILGNLLTEAQVHMRRNFVKCALTSGSPAGQGSQEELVVLVNKPDSSSKHVLKGVIGAQCAILSSRNGRMVKVIKNVTSIYCIDVINYFFVLFTTINLVFLTQNTIVEINLV